MPVPAALKGPPYIEPKLCVLRVLCVDRRVSRTLYFDMEITS